MWKVKDYENKDLNELLKLTKENYGDIDISNDEYLKWEYSENPSGQALIKLAYDSENKIVAGQYVVIPQKLKVNDEKRLGTLSLNTLTKKEYRNQGIFTGLANAVFTECISRGLEFTVGVPNPNSYPVFLNKLMFKEVGKIPLLVRPLNITKYVERKYNYWFSKLFLPIDIMHKIKIEKKKELEIIEITNKNINLIDDIWGKIKDKYKIIGIRDAEFIKWRYLDVPLREYKILGIKRNDSLEGYIIGRYTIIEGIKTGVIVDFILDNDSKLSANTLINNLLTYFQDNCVEVIISLMFKHTKEYEHLKKNLFYKCPNFLQPQIFPLIFKCHNDKCDEKHFNEVGNWFWTFGDFDVV